MPTPSCYHLRKNGQVPVFLCASFLLYASFLANSAYAREVFLLRSGGSLEASSHLLSQDLIVVETATGTLSFPAEEVLAIQNLPDSTVLPSARPEQRRAGASPQSAASVLADAAREQGLERALVQSVARIESNWQASALSPKGALGLMQITPGTAAYLGINARDMKENAAGGAKYLRQLLLTYRGDAALALAAYNAGPGAVAKYGGVPPFPETRRYILRVLRELSREESAAGLASSNATK